MRKSKFPSISPKIRRMLIFTMTVVVGTLLILYDLPIEYLLGGTLAAGCIVLIAFGAVKLSDLRPKNIREGLKKWIEERKQRSLENKSPEKTPQKIKIDPKASDGARGKSGKIRAGLASLSGVFRGGAGRLKASLFHKDENFKEIDKILDAEMTGSGAVKGKPDTSTALSPETNAPAVVSGAVDPLLEIDEEDLENLMLDGEELDLGESPVDMSLDAEMPAISADDSIVSEIFKANAAELEEFSELGDIGELDETLGEIGGEDMDEVDLDSLDLSDEDVSGITPETGSEEDIPEAVPSQDPAGLPELPEEPEEEESPEEDNMVAFASGGGSDSLMDILKSDVKQRRKGEYNSLLRGMKGMKINAEDLVGELEEMLNTLDGGSTVKKNG